MPAMRQDRTSGEVPEKTGSVCRKNDLQGGSGVARRQHGVTPRRQLPTRHRPAIALLRPHKRTNRPRQPGVGLVYTAGRAGRLWRADVALRHFFCLCIGNLV